MSNISEIDLLDGAFYAGDPHPTYEWMRRNSPVYFDAAHNVWGLASYAAVLGASKDPSTFSSTGGIRPDSGPIPMMIDMDDPEHWKRRKVVNRGFTPGRVRDREGEIRDKCDAIIDRVCERGECDFVRDIAAPLPMALIGDMLGVAPEDRDDLLRWSDDMVSSQSGGATEEQFLAAMPAMEEDTEFCTQAGRLQVHRPVPLRRGAPAERARRVRVRRALLSRPGPGAARAARDVRTTAHPHARHRAGRRPRRSPPPPGELHQRARSHARSV